MTRPPAITAGSPDRLGAHVTPRGVNFAVFSAHASRMVLCLCDDDGRETQQIDLPGRTGDIWHGHIAGLAAGQRYGLRAHGPYAPHAGHRFNPHKLLLDPYARQITGKPVWHDALLGYDPAHGPDSFSMLDSAPYMPRAVVLADAPAAPDTRPQTPMAQSLIYEAHLKGLTRTHPRASPAGGVGALGSAPMLAHLGALGITAVELLPIHAFVDDKFLRDRGLTNYWGYQSIGYFAPHPDYLDKPDPEGFTGMVAALHGAGIEVILDVVYNHTGEGDETGPTLSFRGLDNASYYRLAGDRARYLNHTGTGNVLNLEHSMVLRMVMDSLRHWAAQGVDGFRFDLCTTLGRRAAGFDPQAPFFTALAADPVLSTRKLIAEPWDIGPGGYQLGAFPAPFAEWNDRFRDTLRRFWRGDRGMVPHLAHAISGSAGPFDKPGRGPCASVNYVTAHDGFTLADLVAYSTRHNHANGEDNRDGHGENLSDNMGTEGPSDDPSIRAARARRMRNLMATLLLSQGTPMILAGDEIANSQSGNNNAYAQDNPLGWIDWQGADAAMMVATARLTAFRKAHPVLSQPMFLHGRAGRCGWPDLSWWRADGQPMTQGDWDDPEGRHLIAVFRMAADAPDPGPAVMVIANAGAAVLAQLPAARPGHLWVCRIDTTRDDPATCRPATGPLTIPAAALLALVEEPRE